MGISFTVVACLHGKLDIGIPKYIAMKEGGEIDAISGG